MNPSTPEPQDPWDKLHDADRDVHLPETPQSHDSMFTKGEIAFWGCFCVAVLGGICVGAIKILSAWLDIP